MIVDIELKSLDHDDENFSPVFTRAKKEFYLTHSERYKKTSIDILVPLINTVLIKLSTDTLISSQITHITESGHTLSLLEVLDLDIYF